MRDVARYAFAVLATLAGLVLLWQFHLALVLFLLSVVAASALRPSIAALAARGTGRRAAMALVYGGLVLGIAGVTALAARPVAGDLQEFADDAVIGYDRIVMEWPRGGTQLQRAVAGWLPPSEDFYSAVSSEDGLSSMAGVVGAAQGVLTFLARTAIVLVLSMYWSADRRRFEQLSLSLLPMQHHARVLRVWKKIEGEVGAYVRGEVVQSLAAGLVLGVVFWLLGVPYPALLALWVAVVRPIPWFGTVLALVPSVVALIAGYPVQGITTGLATLAVLSMLRWSLGPRFIDLRRYSSLWLVVAIVALGELWGLGGALIAPALAAAIQLLVEEFAPQRTPRPAPASETEAEPGIVIINA